jgi:hypothetical protein
LVELTCYVYLHLILHRHEVTKTFTQIFFFCLCVNCYFHIFDIIAISSFIENCLAASRRKRNYILDQTNVYASARRRKMKPFNGFYRVAAVIQPEDPEMQRRSTKRTVEDGTFFFFFFFFFACGSSGT